MRGFSKALPKGGAGRTSRGDGGEPEVAMEPEPYLITTLLLDTVCTTYLM